MMNRAMIVTFLSGIKTELVQKIKTEPYPSYGAIEIIESYFDELIKKIKEAEQR